jgi:NifU-like protein involved in Fe-S cluster formation
LRFSFGRGTTPADIDIATGALRRELQRLRALSPNTPAPVDDWRQAGLPLRSGEAGSRREGAWVRWHLALDGSGRISGARPQVFGCPQVMAAAQALAAALPGQDLAALAAPTPQALWNALGTPDEWRRSVNAPVEKLGRMLIIEDALRAALACAAAGT